MAAEARSNFISEHSLAGPSCAIPCSGIYTRTLPVAQNKMRRDQKKRALTGFCLTNRHSHFARMIDPWAAHSHAGTPSPLVAPQHGD
jgi:hypothetical protein